MMEKLMGEARRRRQQAIAPAATTVWIWMRAVIARWLRRVKFTLQRGRKKLQGPAAS
jgi:hypothetical protein